MSGGSMDYVFRYVGDAADYVEDKEIKELLKDLSKLLHDLEWWQSGDYGSDSYYKTLDDFKTKWFGDNRNERLKDYIKHSLDEMKCKIDTLI